MGRGRAKGPVHRPNVKRGACAVRACASLGTGVNGGKKQSQGRVRPNRVCYGVRVR
jgi:hypothetical protein